jgi:hypothetical protein
VYERYRRNPLTSPIVRQLEVIGTQIEHGPTFLVEPRHINDDAGRCSFQRLLRGRRCGLADDRAIPRTRMSGFVGLSQAQRMEGSTLSTNSAAACRTLHDEIGIGWSTGLARVVTLLENHRVFLPA